MAFFSALHVLWVYPFCFSKPNPHSISITSPVVSQSLQSLVSVCLLQLLKGWFWVTLLCLQFPSLTVTEKSSFGVLGGSDSVLKPWKIIANYVESWKQKRQEGGGWRWGSTFSSDKPKIYAYSWLLKEWVGELLPAVFSIICLSFILHEAFGHVVLGLGSNLHYLLAFSL